MEEMSRNSGSLSGASGNAEYPLKDCESGGDFEFLVEKKIECRSSPCKGDQTTSFYLCRSPGFSSSRPSVKPSASSSTPPFSGVSTGISSLSCSSSMPPSPSPSSSLSSSTSSVSPPFSFPSTSSSASSPLSFSPVAAPFLKTPVDRLQPSTQAESSPSMRGSAVRESRHATVSLSRPTSPSLTTTAGGAVHTPSYYQGNGENPFSHSDALLPPLSVHSSRKSSGEARSPSSVSVSPFSFGFSSSTSRVSVEPLSTSLRPSISIPSHGQKSPQSLLPKGGDTFQMFVPASLDPSSAFSSSSTSPSSLSSVSSTATFTSSFATHPPCPREESQAYSAKVTYGRRSSQDQREEHLSERNVFPHNEVLLPREKDLEAQGRINREGREDISLTRQHDTRERGREKEEEKQSTESDGGVDIGPKQENHRQKGNLYGFNSSLDEESRSSSGNTGEGMLRLNTPRFPTPCSSSFSYGVEDRTYARCQYTPKHVSPPSSVVLPPRPSQSSSSSSLLLSPSPRNPLLSGSRKTSSLVSTPGGGRSLSTPNVLFQQEGKMSSRDDRPSAQTVPDSSVQDATRKTGEDIIASSLAARAAAEASSRAAEALLGRLRETQRVHSNARTTCFEQEVRRTGGGSDPTVGNTKTIFEDSNQSTTPGHSSSVVPSVGSSSSLSFSPSCRVPENPGGYLASSSLSSGKKSASSDLSPRLFVSSSPSSSSVQALPPALLSQPFHHPTPQQQRTTSGLFDQPLEEKTTGTIGTDSRVEKKQTEQEEGRIKRKEQKSEDETSHSGLSDESLQEDEGHRGEVREGKRWDSAGTSPVLDREDNGKESLWPLSRPLSPSKGSTPARDEERRRARTLNEEATTTAVCQFLDDETSSSYSIKASTSLSSSSSSSSSSPSPPSPSVCSESVISEEDKTCMDEESPVSTDHRPAPQTTSLNSNKSINWAFSTLASSSSSSSSTSSANHVFASSSSSCSSGCYSSLAFHTVRRNTALRPLPRVFLNGNRATASFWISSCLLGENMKQRERDCTGGEKEERPREGKCSLPIEQEEQRLYAKDWLAPGLRDFAEVLREQLEEEDEEEEEEATTLREALDETSSLGREGISTEGERRRHIAGEDVRRAEEETEPRHDGGVLRSDERAATGNAKRNLKRKKQEKTREYIPSLSDGLESLEDLIQHCKQRAFKFLHASLVAGDVPTSSSSFLGGTPSFSFSPAKTSCFLGEERRQEQDHQARQEQEETSGLWGVLGGTRQSTSYSGDSVDRQTERRRRRRELDPESSLSPLPTLLDYRPPPCEDFSKETREKGDRGEKKEKDEEEVDKEGMKRSVPRRGNSSDVNIRDGSALNGFDFEMRGYAEDVLSEDKTDYGRHSSRVYMETARRQQEGGKNQETGDGTMRGERHGDRSSVLQRCQGGSEEGVTGNGSFLRRDQANGHFFEREEGGFFKKRQQHHTLEEEQEKEGEEQGEQGIGFTVQTMVDFYLSVAYLLGQLLKRDRAAKAFYKREVDLLRERLCLTTAQARETFTDAKRQLEEEEMQSRRLSKQVAEKEKRIQQILEEQDDLRRKFREEQRELRLQQEAEIDDLNRQFDAIRKDLQRRDRQVKRLQNELREALYQNQELQRKPQLGRLSDNILPLSRGRKHEQGTNICFRLSDPPGRLVGSESDDSGSGGFLGRQSATATGPFDKDSSGAALSLRRRRHPSERPGSENDQGHHIVQDEASVSVVPKGQGNEYTGAREGILQNRSTTGCLEDRDHRHRMGPSSTMEDGHSTTPGERGGGLPRRRRIFHGAAVTPPGGPDTRAVLPVRTTNGRTSSLDRFNRVQSAARYRQKSARGRRWGASRPPALVDDRIAYQGSLLRRGRNTANRGHGGLRWTTRTWNTDDETGAAIQQSGKFELLTRSRDHFRVFGRWKTTSQENVGCEVCTNDLDTGATTESVDLGSYAGRSDFTLSREWSFSSVRSILSSGSGEVGRLPDAWTTCTTPLFSLPPRNSRVQTLQEELLSVLSVGEREEAVRLLLRANVLQDICTLGGKDAEQALAELALFTTASGTGHEAGGVDGRKEGVPEAQAVLAPYYCTAGSKQFSTNMREKRTVHVRSYLTSTLGYASFFLSLFALDYAVLGGYCASSVLKCIEWTSLLILSRTQELRHGFQQEDAGHPLAYVFQAIERFLLFFLQCLRGVAEPPDDEVLLSYTEMLADQFSGSSWVCDWEGSAAPGVFVSPRNEGLSFGAGLLGEGGGIYDFCPREVPW